MKSLIERGEEMIRGKSLSVILAISLCMISSSICIAAQYETNVISYFTSEVSGTPSMEIVDVTMLEKGINSRSMSGLFSGTAILTETIRFHINSGSYAGWSFGYFTYDINGHTGDFYLILDFNTNQGWAVVRGDIHASVKYSGVGNPDNSATWYVTSINGEDVTGTITMGNRVVLTPTTTTFHTGVNQLIGGPLDAGLATGFYNGPIESISKTIVSFPDFQSGFGFVTFHTSDGEFTVRSFIDNSTSPVYRYSFAEGTIFGSIESFFSPPATEGTQVNRTIEHYITPTPPPPSSTTKVPVHQGLWLIPSAITGLYLLRKRKS